MVQAGNAITGIICFIVFIVILVAMWDFINIQVNYLGQGTTDVAAQFVIAVIPFAIAIAGTFGCYRMIKGKFGE